MFKSIGFLGALVALAGCHLEATAPLDAAVGWATDAGVVFDLAQPSRDLARTPYLYITPKLGKIEAANGSSATMTFSLGGNTGSADVRITGITFTPIADLSLDPASTCAVGSVVDPNVGCTVVFRFAPTKPQAANTILTVTTKEASPTKAFISVHAPAWIDESIAGGPDFLSLSGDTSGNLWACGAGAVYRYTTGSWMPVASPISMTTTICSIAGVSDQLAFFVDGGSTIYYTRDGGTTWDPASSPLSAPLVATAAYPGGDWLVGSNDGAIAYGSPTPYWYQERPGDGNAIAQIVVNPFAPQALAVQAGDVLVRYAANWGSFLNLSSYPGTIKTVWAPSQGYVGSFAGGRYTTCPVGAPCSIVYFLDYNTHLQIASVPQCDQINAVFAGSASAWAVGQNATVAHSSDANVTWVRETLPISTAVDFNAVWAVGDQLVVVGTAGTILRHY